MAEPLNGARTRVEFNEEDEARAYCACGWAGAWRDRLRAAHDDRDDHAEQGGAVDGARGG